MPVITIAGRAYPVKQEKVLLDSLLESRVKVPYSCRSGLCHACMLKADSGSPPVSSQKNLPQEKVRQGYFLACQCQPEEDMQLSLPTRNNIPAIITAKSSLNPTVVSLSVSPRYPVSYSPGQHLTLWASEHLARPCYLASVEGLDNTLIFHVERRINGAFSSWAHNCTATGQKISISNLCGENICDFSSTPQHFVAQGSCLAPILAACRHLSTVGDKDTLIDHKVSISLQAETPDDIYCLDELESLTDLLKSDSIKLFTGTGSLSTLIDSFSALSGKQQFVVAGNRRFIEKVTAAVNSNKALNGNSFIELPYSVD